jgi:outer membrane murein-binding lipoprotein Lpp
MADAALVNKFMRTAYQSMVDARSGKLAGARRWLSRSMRIGSGKKTAGKIAIGVGLGAIAVTVSAVTAGAGLPVIAAIAAGTFFCGQMTNVGFSKLSGRQYRGVQKTNAWIEKFRNSTEDHREDMAATKERAHKTTRRAFEHYRRGVRKGRVLVEAAEAAKKDRTCDSAANMLTAMFSVSHHWDKARLYAIPGIFLTTLLMDTYKDMLGLYTRSEAALRKGIGDLFDEHGGERCGADACFIGDEIDASGAVGPHLLWSDANFEQFMTNLKEHEDAITVSGFGPNTSSVTNPRVQQRAQQFFFDAGHVYFKRRKSIGNKMSHGIKGVFARKTKGERIATAVGVVTSAGLSAGGAAFSGATAGMDLSAAVDPAVEALSQVLENLAAEATEKLSEMADPTGQTDLEHHAGGTKTAADTQSLFQKAAEHMQEIAKVEKTLADTKKDHYSCDTAFERVRLFFKIHHHLVRVQELLTAAWTEFEPLLELLVEKRNKFAIAQRTIYKLTAEIVDNGNHGSCSEVCYSPHTKPAKRVA